MDDTIAYLTEVTGLSLPLLIGLTATGLFALLVLAQILLGSMATGQSGGPSTVRSSSQAKRTKLLLIGPAGAGKTKLFYKLATGDHEQSTVSSTELNVLTSGVKMPAKITGAETE